MKYVVFFLLVCVALAAGAPQLISSWPGLVAPGYIGGLPNTLVAGPTVVNGAGLGYGYGSRLIAPGYVGPALF